jgi:mRNA interferase MazF
MTFRPGDVVLLPFPFRDRLAERARPASVVSTDGYNRLGDVIVAAVTSHAPRTAFDIEVNDWQAANLKVPSTVRMLLAAVSQSRTLHHVGELSSPDWQTVSARLKDAIDVR